MSSLTSAKLSLADMAKAEQAFVAGPAALVRSGMTPEQIAEFFQRPSVVHYFTVLTEEMKRADGGLARSRFIAMRQLQLLSDKAVQTLADGLEGMVYENDKQGKIKTQTVKKKDGQEKEIPVIASFGPAELQVDIARDILDRLGATLKDGTDKFSGLQVNINAIPAPVTLEYEPDASEEQKVLSREKVRLAMERLKERIPRMLEDIANSKGGKKKRKKVKSYVRQPGSENAAGGDSVSASAGAAHSAVKLASGARSGDGGKVDDGNQTANRNTDADCQDRSAGESGDASGGEVEGEEGQA